MISGRSYRVKIGNSVSDDYVQGTKSSPTLYNLFVHDIPRLTNCHIAQLADDLAIYCTDMNPDNIQSNLQKAINMLTEYCNDWKIQLNANVAQDIYRKGI